MSHTILLIVNKHANVRILNKNNNIHTGTSKDWLLISIFGYIGVGEYAIYKAVAAAAPVIAASPNVPPTYCK